MSLPTPEDEEIYDKIEADLDIILETPHEQDPDSKRCFEDNVRVVEFFRKKLDEAHDFSKITDEDYHRVVRALDYLCFCGAIFLHTSLFPPEDLSLRFIILDDVNVEIMASTVIHGSTHVVEINLAHHKTSLDIIGSLVHEMAHMVIQKLQRVEELNNRSVLHHLIGVSGHGYYWQRLARVVEKRAREIVNKDINVGRIGAVSKEREMSGIAPSQAYCEMIFGGQVVDDGRPAVEHVRECVEDRHTALNKKAFEEIAFPIDEEEIMEAGGETGGTSVEEDTK